MPDDGLLTYVVPMHPAKNLTAFAGDDYLSKHVVAAEGSGLSVWACVHNTAADKLLLHLHENFTQDDGFMAVLYIVLQNEKYMGDALLQKTYTVDFLTKMRVKNEGIVPQYYVENNHEAIIPRELYLQVQEEMKRRSLLFKGKDGKRRIYSSKYALSSITFCSNCGDIIDGLIGTTVVKNLLYGDALHDWKRDRKVAHQGQFRRKTSMLQ